jgi:hypothetical protein
MKQYVALGERRPGTVASAALRSDGHARLTAAELRALLGGPDGDRAASDCESADALAKLVPSWNELPHDEYLRDGGRYRARRHACFVQDTAASTLTRTPHRAHWQPTTYNALHGGLERWFEPITATVAEADCWRRLLLRLGELFAALAPVPRWYIEAHQFRIDTASGIGRPTPEGAHRDGVDWIAIALIERRGIVGGETRVFPAGSAHGVRFTLDEPWSVLLLDDRKVVHETTPIQSAGPEPGWRDTLVLTYRAQGFQAP